VGDDSLSEFPNTGLSSFVFRVRQGAGLTSEKIKPASSWGPASFLSFLTGAFSQRGFG
jgi:hypothetical protein